MRGLRQRQPWSRQGHEARPLRPIGQCLAPVSPKGFHRFTAACVQWHHAYRPPSSLSASGPAPQAARGRTHALPEKNVDPCPHGAAAVSRETSEPSRGPRPSAHNRPFVPVDEFYVTPAFETPENRPSACDMSVGVNLPTKGAFLAVDESRLRGRRTTKPWTARIATARRERLSFAFHPHSGRPPVRPQEPLLLMSWRRGGGGRRSEAAPGPTCRAASYPDTPCGRFRAAATQAPRTSRSPRSCKAGAWAR